MIEAANQTADDSQEQYAREAERLLAEGNSANFDQISAVGVNLLHEFAQAETDRRMTELRWLQDLRQYRGQYDPDVLAKIGKDRSRVFVKKTGQKVKTLDARVGDLQNLSSVGKNWTISPTPKPTIEPEQVEAITQALTQALKRPPEEFEIDAQVQAFVAKASSAMSTTIEDQLAETKYKRVARKVVHSGHLYGTGILKAPLVERKVRQRFVKEKGKWVMKSESYVVPFVDFVPVWRWYPDMSATELEHCRYAYERHTMNKAAFAALAERKSFAKEKIVEYILANPDGLISPKYYDAELRIIGERATIQNIKAGQYEVLERWGWMDAQSLIACGIDVPQERAHETFFSNIWILPNGEVIRAALQPINGVTWPYHVYYFDKDETSIFAEGIPTVMRDDQITINAATRMELDNAAITAGPQFEINVRLLSENEKTDEVSPFKIWARSGEDPTAQAVRVIEVPNHLTELAGLKEQFEVNADETTTIPRYMTGENVNSGAGGTASGLSMLMGAAAIVVKDQVIAYDEGITKPFITALYRWNMQFSADDSIKGDFDVVAEGASSLVAKELRQQHLAQFSTSVQPEERPWIKWDKVVQAKADSLDLPGIVKTTDEMNLEQSSGLGQMQAQLQQQMAALQLATAQAQVAKLTAEIGKLRAETVSKNVESAYAAMQAGGVVVTNPHIAPAGDEILRSSGWVDATPDQTVEQAAAQPENAAPVPVDAQADGQAQQIDQAAIQDADSLAQQDGSQAPAGGEFPPTGHAGQRAGIETARIEQ